MKKLLLAILFIVFTFTVVACDVPMTGSGLSDGGSSDSGESGDGEIVTQVTEEEWNKAFAMEGIPSYEVLMNSKFIDKYGYVDRFKQKTLVVGNDFAYGHIGAGYEVGEVEDEGFEFEEIEFDEYFDVTGEECEYFFMYSGHGAKEGWHFRTIPADDRRVLEAKPNLNNPLCDFSDVSYNEEEGCYEWRDVLDEEGYFFFDYKIYFENSKLIKIVGGGNQEEGEVSATITISYGDYKLYFPKDAEEWIWGESSPPDYESMTPNPDEEEANGQESQQESESMIEEEIIEN